MKKKYLWGVAFCMLVCIWGCSDQDDNLINPDKMIQMYGYPYNLQSGVIWQSNPNAIVSSIPYIYEDTYEKGGTMVTDRVEGFRAGDERIETGNFMISLYETGLYGNMELEKAQGEGACICFHLASPELGELAPGKYVFGADKEPYTFIGYCSSDYNTQNKENIPAVLSEGEVTVEKNGDKYRVVFQCKTTFGGDITGEYNGTLQQHRVSQVSSTEYNNVSLSGLMDEVEIVMWYTGDVIRNILDQIGLEGFPLKDGAEMLGLIVDGEKFIDPESSGTDFDTEYNGMSLFSLSTGLSQIANNARKNREQIDLALTWNKEQEAFYFESPIRIRSMLDHKSKYDFPCHTVYMNAPEGFSETDFENLSADDFSFQITEQKVKISTVDFKPAYVFFQTGKGVLGVIKVKSYVPQDMKTEYDIYSGGYIDSPLNPSLQLEIKCPAVVANPQIR